MTGNRMMEYYVRPWHLYSHNRTCTHSDLCRRISAWWHSTYATSLIIPVFMRFHLSWFDSIVCHIYSASMEILIHCISSSWIFCILYIVCGDDHTCHILYIMPIHGHCTLMYPGLLYAFAIAWRDWLLYYTDGWLVLPPGSSSLHFWDGFYNVFRPSFSPLTSHIRGHILEIILPHQVDHTFMAFHVPL